MGESPLKRMKRGIWFGWWLATRDLAESANGLDRLFIL